MENVMTNKRDIFAELTEGFDALKSEREVKLTLRTFKLESKPSRSLSPQKVPQVGERLEAGDKGGHSPTHKPRC
jgi:putative transcriptional regulator